MEGIIWLWTLSQLYALGVSQKVIEIYLYWNGEQTT